MRQQRMIDLFRTTLDLPGDMAECGCYRGLSSYLLCGAVKNHDPFFSGNGHHVFDSFQGLSQPQKEDTFLRDHPDFEASQTMNQPSHFATSLETVKKIWLTSRMLNFIRAGFPKILKG